VIANMNITKENFHYYGGSAGFDRERGDRE
jgi:hypothetical protein